MFERNTWLLRIRIKTAWDVHQLNPHLLYHKSPHFSRQALFTTASRKKFQKRHKPWPEFRMNVFCTEQEIFHLSIVHLDGGRLSYFYFKMIKAGNLSQNPSRPHLAVTLMHPSNQSGIKFNESNESESNKTETPALESSTDLLNFTALSRFLFSYLRWFLQSSWLAFEQMKLKPLQGH